MIVSLKSPSCLSKFTQTWREKPANSSDLAHFSGKSFRLGEKSRLHASILEGQSRARFKVRLKSAKNLCLGHRFFDEIRQNPPILLCFQANVTDSLQKSGAHWTAQLPTRRATSRLCSHRWRTARLANRNAPVGGHPGPEEIENCGNDGQNDDGGNQRACI